MYVVVLPLHVAGQAAGALAIVRRAAPIPLPVLRHAVLGAAQTILIVALTLLIVHWNLGRPHAPHARCR